jgi:apolipoprotein N-acyltransferase
MKKPPESLLNFALALLSAVLLVLTFPNPALGNTGLPWLAPLALTPLLIALSRETRPLRRFLLGECAGFVYWFSVCYWIQFVLEYHGGMGRWGGWGTFVLFSVAKAIHLGVFSLFAAILIRKPYAIPAIAALWTGIERTHATFGFAWLDLGNAAIDMALPLRLAPFLGVYGISFLFALMGTTVAVLILHRNRRELYWLAVTPALLLLPDLPAPATGTETAVAIQPNMSEDEQWTLASAGHERDHLIKISREAALRERARLILWPETPGPLYYYQDFTFREEAARLTRDTHAYFLFGTVGETPQGAPLNSAVLLRPSGDLEDRYDKINLVPFGEYVPRFFSFVNRITKEAGDFAPGTRIVVFPTNGHSMGVFICYESAFPAEVRQFAKRGANLLVNISNDGYFGRSAAREQHLLLARMRAAENRRWLLRATNDGITAAIDPAGRVAERWPMYQELSGRMAFAYITGATFYTEYGDWFAWGCLLAATIALFCSQRPHYTPRAIPANEKRETRNGLNRAGSPTHRRP